jgi:hypothetical protein
VTPDTETVGSESVQRLILVNMAETEMSVLYNCNYCLTCSHTNVAAWLGMIQVTKSMSINS